MRGAPLGSGSPEHGGGREEGEKGEEAEGVPIPSSPWAEVACGGGSTGAGGGRRWSSGQWHSGARGGEGMAGSGLWQGGGRLGPLL